MRCVANPTMPRINKVLPEVVVGRPLVSSAYHPFLREFQWFYSRCVDTRCYKEVVMPVYRGGRAEGRGHRDNSWFSLDNLRRALSWKVIIVEWVRLQGCRPQNLP